MRKKREEIEEAKRAKPSKVLITFDLVGGKVVYHFVLLSWIDLSPEISCVMLSSRFFSCYFFSLSLIVSPLLTS